VEHVDYDRRLHSEYVSGAVMSSVTLGQWLDAFDRWLPAARPLVLADVGSGTGRFSSELAERFGTVVAVEPSSRMRAQAPKHDRVTTLGGRCEQLPVRDKWVDAALLYAVWHHVEDKPRAAIELARVVRPGGRALLRSTASDRWPDLWWYPWFSRAEEVDRAMGEPVDATRATMSAAGWELVALDSVAVDPCVTRGEDLARLRTRSMSTFEHLTDDECDEGFAAIAAGMRGTEDVPVAPVPADLFVFAKR
jgi:ubiquinone/menaquinone biosynthesis C-methylase UbiE